MLEFENLIEEKGITLSPLQLNQFNTYYETLVEWNEKINLTAITEKENVYLKHFYDSLTPSFFFDFSKVNTLCDVGSGAGFPSIPLKILFPHLSISIVDALNKRINFLKELTEKLGLENIHLYHDRAETFSKKDNIRESFDLVTARAVANLSTLSEYCLPLAKLNGYFLAMKGLGGEEELNKAENALSILGGQVEKSQPMILPKEESHRFLIFIKKIKVTPKKYPRKPGVPNKQPL